MSAAALAWTDMETAVGGNLKVAFVAAHLLTGSAEEAERATMAAMELWDPDRETQEVFFQNVLEVAAVAPETPDVPCVSDAYLPRELRAVLRLPLLPRRCFVLRIIAGLPPDVCARILQVSASSVDEFTCAALAGLSRGRLA